MGGRRDTKAARDNDILSGVEGNVHLRERSPAHSQKRIVIHSIFYAAATFLIAVLYPLDRPADELTDLPFLGAYSWIAAQAFLPMIPLTPLALLTAMRWPRVGFWFGAIVLACVPVIVLLDSITFHWIGERFLSRTMLHVGWSLLPGLLPFVGIGSIVAFVVAVFVLVALFVLSCWSSGHIARRWSVEQKGDITPVWSLAILSLISVLMASPALTNLDRTVSEMHEHSTRHPLCSVGLVGYRGVGVSPPVGAAAVESRLHGFGLFQNVTDRAYAFNENDLLQNDAHDQLDSETGAVTSAIGADLPDVVIVIVESLQSAILSAEVMPNVHAYAQRGYHLRNHFTGGNSSNLGIFSLVYGIEATWFPSNHVISPALNRLFREAGYRLGFYGGTDDWATFNMHPFINEQEYDEFMIEPADWLESDLRTIDRAAAFLSRQDLPPPSESVATSTDLQGRHEQPRLAVVYMYSSHAPYHSFPEDEIFQPVASRYFSPPYTESMRQPIWNRYRNSVRSVDRMIKTLLREDRVIVVCGDHGESFLEDQTIMHGTRMSQVQNMTPCVIYVPGHAPRAIDELTMHADVLPTTLAAVGLSVQHPDYFDGVDLTTATSSELSTRVLATCSYMSPELMLVGPWTKNPAQPFGLRCLFSIDPWQLAVLNPVDHQGLEWRGSDNPAHGMSDEESRRLFSNWLVSRFGTDPTSDRRSVNELFREYISYPNSQVRQSAVELAQTVDDPDDELIDLVSRATADESGKVREAAREAVIVLQRRSKSR